VVYWGSEAKLAEWENEGDLFELFLIEICILRDKFFTAKPSYLETKLAIIQF
jgi:hypothetical protein|tara:strand:- start:881 stop:1036 length:156 start_codon:yes stop_codon:yes gene_type:complete